jgi:hypothetical protein
MSRRGIAALAAPAIALALAFAPAPLRAQPAGADTVVLAWTAPGDDDDVGTASQYELRMSGSPIDDANWSAATVVNGMPTPLPAGSRQSLVVQGLTRGTTYYFAMRSIDDAGNWSGISNLLQWDWIYDTAAPAAPLGIAGVLQPGGAVEVTWSANAEADLYGYTVYRATSAGEPFVPVTPSLVATTRFVDTTVPSGVAAVWYDVTAMDDSGNESAHSSSTRVTLAGAGAWAMEAAYPNPSGAGTVVTLPVTVPASGGNARLEITNSVGQRVRHLDPGGLAPGVVSVLWDGRNDAGREVAPGAYTAWLIAGSTRARVRLVRVP